MIRNRDKTIKHTASCRFSSAHRRSGGKRYLSTLLLLGGMALSSTGVAADWQGLAKALHPYAELGLEHDSNLLRDPIDERSDTLRTLTLGFDGDFTISKQVLQIGGQVSRNDYDRFDTFNHTAGDAYLRWKWAVGRLWSGDIGYSFDRQLRAFANQDIPEKDPRERHRVRASINRWLTDRWRLGAKGRLADISFEESSSLDKQLVDADLSLDYVSRIGNTVGMEARWQDARFDNADNRDFEEYVIGPTLDWQVGGKLRLKANVGYLSREHDVETSRDFDGFVGNLKGTWQITGKTSLNFHLWRDLSSLNDDIADYAVIDGISLEPTWNITAKTTLRGVASYEERDFDERVPSRLDDVTVVGVWLDWNPRDNISVSVGYSIDDRDSTLAVEEYESEILQARVRVGF
ncbi:MAG: outer membrane beta-barrel protein [Chromatiales bacterium]|nr:outer membrane beta-barrel protein [Chromatiales bacterium]